ncbi:C-type lectin domain family 2 member B-like isoform X1 [Carettochelys insculpta]|uniref:C-type lectin domain family 2 member B-like isoform X1 n=1 Tax=Carettochelys insculpta TaxID=44489 RepID=UPI003EB6C5C7
MWMTRSGWVNVPRFKEQKAMKCDAGSPRHQGLQNIHVYELQADPSRRAPSGPDRSWTVGAQRVSTASLAGCLPPSRGSWVCIALVCVSCVAAGLLITVVALAVGVCKPPVACSSAWLAFEGKCYYFSEIEGNWTYSRSNCSALGASLAAVDTQPEHDFMLRYKGFRDHWIGLQREEDSQPWRWVNGTEFNQWFQIGGGGQCAYLKESTTVSSSRCSMERHWICRRALK